MAHQCQQERLLCPSALCPERILLEWIPGDMEGGVGENIRHLIRSMSRKREVQKLPILTNTMDPHQVDKKPEPGDLIEIQRGTYQHWAIYVGDGYVIHLAPPTEHAQAGAYSMMSVLCDKAVVKKEHIWDVVGTDKYTINNLLDDKYEPRPICVILRDAQDFLDRELPYCVFRGNCEHFVTELRYGKAESRQVRKAVEVGIGIGVAALIGVGVLAAARAFLGNKEDKSSQ